MQLLERDAFLAQLDGELGEAGQGHGRLVLVCGEAGIGKTALVDAFSARLSGREQVVWGACDAVTPARPFAPLVDIADQVGGELRAALRAGDRHRASDAFLGLLRSQASPRVIVFEDVQWVDDATLELLRVTSRRLRTFATLIIATYRDDEVGPAHPFRIALGEVPPRSKVTISLPPLSPAAVHTLVDGTGIDSAALHLAAGGNPFFVTEVVAAGGDELPATVRDAVWARASRRSAGGRDVLRAASVVGRGDAAILEAVSGSDRSGVDECVDAGMLIASGGTLGFRHELARLAVLEGLSSSERVELHRRALAAWQASGDEVDPARLAQHASAAGDRDAILDFGPAAARRAASLGAHREAVGYYATVLPFAEGLEADARARLLRAYSEECYLTADLAAAITAQEHAMAAWREIGDAAGEGDSLQTLAHLWWCAGNGVLAQDLAVEAVDLLEMQAPGPELARAYATLAQLIMVGGHDHQAAVAVGKRAVELGGQLGEEQVVVHALNTVGTAEVCMEVSSGWAKLEESLQRARAAGLHDDVGRALVNLVAESRHVRDYQRAEHHLAEAVRYTTVHDLELLREFALAYAAEVALELGRWDEVEDVASTALERGPVHANMARVAALTALGRLRARRGDPDPWGPLDEALAVALPQGDLLVVCPLRAARAEAAWLAGDHSKASAEAEAGLSVVLRHASPWWRGELAFWRWKATGENRQPDGCAEPYRLQMDGDVSRAAAAWAALGCPYQQALALGDSPDEGALRHALTLFHTLGAAPGSGDGLLPAALDGRPLDPSRAAPADPRQPSRAHCQGAGGAPARGRRLAQRRDRRAARAVPEDRRPPRVDGARQAGRAESPGGSPPGGPARPPTWGARAPKIGSASRCGARRRFVPSADPTPLRGTAPPTTTGAVMTIHPPHRARPGARGRRLGAALAIVCAGSAIGAACSSAARSSGPEPTVAATTDPTTTTPAMDAAMDHGDASPSQQPVEISISRELARARAATARYATDLDAAKAAGYRIITPMMPGMGYHYMNPAVQGFDIEQPPILVYELTGTAAQLAALEWVFPTKPETPPIDGATYGTFAAACHYDDGTFVASATESACARTSPATGSSFVFWHPDLVTMHVWLWYPNPDGLFSSTNPLVTPFDEPARPAPVKGTMRLERWQETHGA